MQGSSFKVQGDECRDDKCQEQRTGGGRQHERQRDRGLEEKSGKKVGKHKHMGKVKIPNTELHLRRISHMHYLQTSE